MTATDVPDARAVEELEVESCCARPRDAGVALTGPG